MKKNISTLTQRGKERPLWITEHRRHTASVLGLQPQVQRKHRDTGLFSLVGTKFWTELKIDHWHTDTSNRPTLYPVLPSREQTLSSAHEDHRPRPSVSETTNGVTGPRAQTRNQTTPVRIERGSTRPKKSPQELRGDARTHQPCFQGWLQVLQLKKKGETTIFIQTQNDMPEVLLGGGNQISKVAASSSGITVRAVRRQSFPFSGVQDQGRAQGNCLIYTWAPSTCPPDTLWPPFHPLGPPGFIRTEGHWSLGHWSLGLLGTQLPASQPSPQTLGKLLPLPSQGLGDHWSSPQVFNPGCTHWNQLRSFKIYWLDSPGGNKRVHQGFRTVSARSAVLPYVRNEQPASETEKQSSTENVLHWTAQGTVCYSL